MCNFGMYYSLIMIGIQFFLSQMDSNFKNWEAAMIQKESQVNGEIYFTRDGIMDNSCVGKEKSAELWFNSDFRPLVLLKDQYQHSSSKSSEDITEWFKLNPSIATLSQKFFRNIANILWGLKNIDANGNDWWLPEIDMHIDELKDFFRTQPMAFVECKKQPGGSSVSSREIRHHLNTYSEFLKEEIDLLSPNYIICCGADIFDFACKTYQPVGSGNIRRCSDTGMYIIYAGHPSCRSSAQNYYEGVMYHYRNFIKEQKGVLQ